MKRFDKNILKAVSIFGLLTLAACEKGNENVNTEIPPIPFTGTFMEKLNSPLSDKIIYSKNVGLARNSVIQSMDISKDGSIYYLQIAGSSSHQLNLIKGAPNQNKPEEIMVFEYFGHGTNLAIEETDTDTFVWLGSYGNKGTDGEYGGSQVISRIKYEKGKTVQSGAGEHFYLQGKRNIHPAINKEKDIMAIEYSQTVSGISVRFFKAYRLSEVMNLVPETMVLESPVTYGGENGVPEKTEKPEILARDLSKATPLYSFAVSDGFAGDKPTDGIVGKFPFQGFDADEQFIYYYEGSGNDNKPNVTSKAYISIIDKNGKLSERKEVMAITDNNALTETGIADRGYMEAEGIKVKNETLYLGFASRKIIDGTDTRLANIFKYAEQ